MSPRRRVTDQPHGPEMVQFALDNLRARFPVAFAARDVQPVIAMPPGFPLRCQCGSAAVVLVLVDVGGAAERHALCFLHAEVLLEPAPETTRDRSEHTAARS